MSSCKIACVLNGAAKMATTGRRLGLLKAQKYSPQMLIGLGVVGFVGTVVLASRATIKAQEILIEHDNVMDDIKHVREDKTEEEYTPQEYSKDVTIAVAQTGARMVVLYGPAATLGVASVACFLGAHGIMHRRHVVLAGMYKMAEETLARYRWRVREDQGELKDYQYLTGMTRKEETISHRDEETGKKVKEKVVSLVPGSVDESMYLREFKPVEFDDDGNRSGSTTFDSQHYQNVTFLRMQEKWMNDKLQLEGFVFLNEVLEALGFERNAIGQAAGWVHKNPHGDGYISFTKALEFGTFKDGSPIPLDFNVDGNILDLI
jgi:hypothetical protein